MSRKKSTHILVLAPECPQPLVDLIPENCVVIAESDEQKVEDMLSKNQVSTVVVPCRATIDEMIDTVVALNFATRNYKPHLCYYCDLESRIMTIPGSHLWSKKISVLHSLSNEHSVSLLFETVNNT